MMFFAEHSSNRVLVHVVGALYTKLDSAEALCNGTDPARLGNLRSFIGKMRRPNTPAIFLHVACIATLMVAPAVVTAQQETVLHSFAENDGVDGDEPVAGLVSDAAGKLYGTTAGGGVNTGCLQIGCGTVFELSPTAGGGWTERILHNFSEDGIDGYFPSSSLVIDSAGNLYGTTNFGGANYYGAVFELSPGTAGKWTEKILYSFNNNGSDGYNPWSGVVIGTGGRLYGTTPYGGTHSAGTVFQLTPHVNGKWTEKILHSFGSGTDGTFPWGGVVVDKSGNLYGTGETGGSNTGCLGELGCGIVFELSNKNGQWSERVLHTFTNNGATGAFPFAGLTVSSTGDLYGTTIGGGTFGMGTVFQLSRNKSVWTERVIQNFDGTTGAARMEA